MNILDNYPQENNTNEKSDKGFLWIAIYSIAQLFVWPVFNYFIANNPGLSGIERYRLINGVFSAALSLIFWGILYYYTTNRSYKTAILICAVISIASHLFVAGGILKWY